MIEGKISKSSQRGITLIALVVTIIVLLILAGITLSMITGDNGIIKQAKGAKQQTEIQGYKEELELIGIKVEKVSKGLNDKEYMDKYEEEIKKDEAFKEAEVTRKDDETIEVVTKEGYEIEVTKDKVEYIGEGEGGESTGNEENTGNTSNTENTGDTENTVGDEEVAPPDLQQSDIDSTIIPNTYTNQAVTVKITSKIDGYTLQYSKYGTNNWEYYTDEITAEHNGVIYVRLWNGKEAGGYTTVNIGIIDRLDPKEFSLNVKEVTENSITVEGSTEDAEATEEDGCSGIKVYYFSKDNGTTWEPSEGQEGTSYTFTGLTEGTDYQMKMKAVDNAENDIETTTVTQKTKEEMIKPGEAADKNENYIDGDGDKAVIPGGFEIVPGLDDVSEGLVIRDDKGNEFVWVPAEVSEMANMTSGTDANGNQNYQGKLYNFTSTDATEMTSYGQGTKSYREPDTVSNYDNNSDYLKIIKDILTDQTDKYTDINTFKKTMQEDYNKMIKSISNYHGFYVSRYEMSKSSNNTAASVGNVTPIVNDSDNKWYGLYAYGKTYTNSANSVESSMIWGSQYDAMMRWMQSGEHKVDVTLKGNRNTSTTTKASTTDVIKNIYDLYGCHYEWTLEAYITSRRVVRGGNYSGSISPSDRNDNGSNDSNSGYSSRLTLYVK